MWFTNYVTKKYFVEVLPLATYLMHIVSDCNATQVNNNNLLTRSSTVNFTVS